MKSRSQTMALFLCCFLLFHLFVSSKTFPQTTIYTPEGAPVTAWTFSEFSASDIAYWNDYGDNLATIYGLNAGRIGNSSNVYNCHGYAWSVSEGGPVVWIGAYSSEGDPEATYWSDASYANDGQPSYKACPEPEATHAWYNPGDHSVRRIINSYPAQISGGRDYVSKWGWMGLYHHQKGHDIYRRRSTTGFDFKKLKNTHSGTLSNFPKTWIGAGGKAHTISSNIACPNNLTIKSGATVNLSTNHYSIISTGGTIVLETGATINGLAAKLMYGSQLKGLCCTVQTAIDNCAYPYSVHIQSGNFNELVTINNKPNIIVGGEYGTLVNGISIYNSNGAEVDVLATHHMFLSGCTLPYLQEILVVPYSEEAEGSFFAYNNSYMNLRGITLSNTPYGYGACFSSSTGSSYPPGLGYGLDFANNECATLFYSGSSFTLHHPHFCSNGTDISTDASSGVTCVDGPTFSGDPHQTTYGNVGWTSYSICGQLSKSAPPSRSSALVGDASMDEFQSLNTFYHEISGKMLSDKGDYSQAFSKFVDRCRSFISSNTESPFATTVLNLAVHAYKQMKDYEGLESFLEEVMKEKDLKGLEGRAKRHLIDCYTFRKNYDTALKIAEEILHDNSADTSLVCDVLFAKGLLYEYSMNRTDEAKLMYRSIAGSYPQNSFAKMARERMAILGNGGEPPQKNANASKVSTRFVASNYPNPFNPVTIISYTVPHDEKVVLKVYDVLGREVRQLVNEYKTAGKYSVTFDGSDLPSGIYLYRIQAGSFSSVGKMLLMK